MDECKFQVGDIVQIRDWDDMANEYGTAEYTRHIKTPIFYLTHMRNLCGETSIITEITPFKCSYLIKLARNEHGYFGDDYKWYFCQEMLKIAGWTSKFSNQDYIAVLDFTI